MTNDLTIPILITGGSGFLGINLVRHLIRRGFENLTVLDIADFDYPDVKDMIRYIKGDIRDTQTIAGAMANVRCVVHTAAALPLYKAEDIYSTEVEGTKKTMQNAKFKDPKTTPAKNAGD